MCKLRLRQHSCSDGIIGINGKLPWDHLPTDRKIFEDLTRNRILVLGRKTLLDEQDGSLDHVGHAKHCIVVSRSVSSLEELISSSGGSSGGNEDAESSVSNQHWQHILKLAGSFEEALNMARDLAEAEGFGGSGGDDVTSTAPGRNHSQSCNNDALPPSIPTISSAADDGILCWVAGGEKLYEEALKHFEKLWVV